MSFRSKHWPTAELSPTELDAKLIAFFRRGLSCSTYGRGPRISKAQKKATKRLARRSPTLFLPPPPRLPRAARRDHRFCAIARAQAAAEDPDDDAFPGWKDLWRPLPDPFPPDPWLQALLAFRPRPCACAACAALHRAADEDH